MELSGRGVAREIIYRLPSIVEPLQLLDLFEQKQPLEVELGSGDGSFLVAYAKANSGRNFIGVERLLGRIRKMERKARREGLTNLRGIRIESSYFVEYLLPPHTTAALHVYFPDPWPKRKHRRNRLVNEHFAELAHRVLVPGGRIDFRTDDLDYFAQIQGVFARASGFSPIETPEPLAATLTDFEQEFVARGIKTLRAAYEAR